MALVQRGLYVSDAGASGQSARRKQQRRQGWRPLPCRARQLHGAGGPPQGARTSVGSEPDFQGSPLPLPPGKLQAGKQALVMTAAVPLDPGNLEGPQGRQRQGPPCLWLSLHSHFISTSLINKWQLQPQTPGITYLSAHSLALRPSTPKEKCTGHELTRAGSWSEAESQGQRATKAPGKCECPRVG